MLRPYLQTTGKEGGVQATTHGSTHVPHGCERRFLPDKSRSESIAVRASCQYRSNRTSPRALCQILLMEARHLILKVAGALPVSTQRPDPHLPVLFSPHLPLPVRPNAKPPRAISPFATARNKSSPIPSSTYSNPACRAQTSARQNQNRHGTRPRPTHPAPTRSPQPSPRRIHRRPRRAKIVDPPLHHLCLAQGGKLAVPR